MSKATYDSKYTDRKVTAAQYMAEIMIVRMASKEGVKLEQKFWNDPKWGKPFKFQKTLADNLLKLYSEGAIVQALADKTLEWAYSLNTKKLISKIESIARIQEKEVVQEEPVTTQRVEVKEKSLFDLI